MLTSSGLSKAALKVIATVFVLSVTSFPFWDDIYAITGSIYLMVPWAQERDWEDHGPGITGAAWESVEIRNTRGLRISGWWVHAPADKGTIILAHGSHSDRRSMVGMARVLYEHGYSSLLLDLSAYGRSDGIVSGLGLREGDDIAAAASFLRGRGESRVGALGASLGAVAVIMGASYTGDIKAIVADSPYADLNMLMEHWGKGRDIIVPPLFRWLVGTDPSQINPLSALRTMPPRPLMIVGGEQDLSIPAAHFRLVYDAASGPKELWVVPEAPHVGAQAARPEEYTNRVIGFFDTHLTR